MKYLENIKTTCADKFNELSFKAEQHAPELYLASAVILGGLAIGTACWATLKAKKVIDERTPNINELHERVTNTRNALKSYEHNDEYRKTLNCQYSADKKLLTLSYCKVGLEITRVFIPTIILGSASLACSLKSNSILNERNVSLAAAYATASQSLKNLEENVAEKYGAETLNELKKKSIEESQDDKSIDDRNESMKQKAMSKCCNGYDMFFDELSSEYINDPYYNKATVMAVLKDFNNVLIRNKRVYLNQVREALGYDPIPEGQVLGWVYNPNDPSLHNFIDFGLGSDEDPSNDPDIRAFMEEKATSVLLHMNIDGYILDYDFNKFKKN